jgi:hypothetical protein
MFLDDFEMILMNIKYQKHIFKNVINVLKHSLNIIINEKWNVWSLSIYCNIPSIVFKSILNSYYPIFTQ